MKSFHIILLALYFFSTFSPVYSQDSLTVKILQPLTYHFNIKDGQLIGDGADFLKKEIASAQFTLLGDYIDSKNISELTTALIPILNTENYKTMALGIGSISAQKIQKEIQSSKHALDHLKSINNKYKFKEGDKTNLPIPDLKYVEDAVFIAKAVESDWAIIGFGNESWNGLILLLDEMYSNLTSDKNDNYKDSYKASVEAIKKHYAERNGDLLNFSNSIQNDSAIIDFIKIAATKTKNKLIIEEFNNSIQRAWMHASKMYFEKNEIRVLDEKRLLKQELENINFNIEQDKLFVKWDFNFLSKGFQPYAFYGIGNTLNEIAAYNGHSSLNIGVMRRFYLHENKIKDSLNNPNSQAEKLKGLLQMGLKDEWVAIDIRPLIQGHFYHPVKYLFNDTIKDLIKRYDIIIIPKTEREPTPNYD